MKQLFLIGIGTGNPGHVTGQAINAMRGADVILIPHKGAGKEDLADLRHEICDRFVDPKNTRLIGFDIPTRRDDDGYLPGVEDWHDAIAAAWQAALPEDAQTVALLVWGDPSLYDSTLRIAARLHPAPKVKVIAGITSLQALTAAHAIPVNTLGAAFTVTTGRRLREAGWPGDMETVAVMLDGSCSFQDLAAPERYDIWWGAYLGMESEILHHGVLSEVTDEIVAKRAAARAAHGWIMDIYLLRRRF